MTATTDWRLAFEREVERACRLAKELAAADAAWRDLREFLRSGLFAAFHDGASPESRAIGKAVAALQAGVGEIEARHGIGAARPEALANLAEARRA